MSLKKRSKVQHCSTPKSRIVKQSFAKQKTNFQQQYHHNSPKNITIYSNKQNILFSLHPISSDQYQIIQKMQLKVKKIMQNYLSLQKQCNRKDQIINQLQKQNQLLKERLVNKENSLKILEPIQTRVIQRVFTPIGGGKNYENDEKKQAEGYCQNKLINSNKLRQGQAMNNLDEQQLNKNNFNCNQLNNKNQQQHQKNLLRQKQRSLLRQNQRSLLRQNQRSILRQSKSSQVLHYKINLQTRSKLWNREQQNKVNLNKQKIQNIQTNKQFKDKLGINNNYKDKQLSVQAEDKQFLSILDKLKQKIKIYEQQQKQQQQLEQEQEQQQEQKTYSCINLSQQQPYQQQQQIPTQHNILPTHFTNSQQSSSTPVQSLLGLKSYQYLQNNQSKCKINSKKQIQTLKKIWNQRDQEIKKMDQLFCHIDRKLHIAQKQ